MIRISRPCYDKYHRCPGWAGGGNHYAKVKRCKDGRIQVNYDDKWHAWKFWRCNECNVMVLPYHANKLSIFWLRYELGWKFRNWRDERKWKRDYNDGW